MIGARVSFGPFGMLRSGTAFFVDPQAPTAASATFGDVYLDGI
jgi:hypothetical protein